MFILSVMSGSQRRFEFAVKVVGACAEFPSSPWGSAIRVAEGGGLAFAPHTEVPYQPPRCTLSMVGLAARVRGDRQGSALVAKLVACREGSLRQQFGRATIALIMGLYDFDFGR
jgi:hypothetical protein